MRYVKYLLDGCSEDKDKKNEFPKIIQKATTDWYDRLLISILPLYKNLKNICAITTPVNINKNGERIIELFNIKKFGINLR